MRRIGLALLATALFAAPAQGAETKYSVANGCFEVAKGAPTGPYRLKATTLAQYLLYTADGKYLTPDGLADEASEAAEWRATEAGDAIELESLAEGPKLTLGPSATGCAEYPEVELSVSGKPLTAPFWFGEQRGFVEGHIHMMAFEFLGGSLHCGRPWHEYGAPYALVDCPDHQATDGCGAVIETGLGAGACHDPGGWPTFAGWPRHDHITHEQTYYRWLERAWMGGLRLYQNLFVENSVLCELYPLKRNSCNEMASVRLQVRDIYEMQNYIDAQSGGPGKGFFRIVTDPFQARRVIARGQLAVVLGIEVSELFNCSHFNYEPDCTKEDIDKQLDEVYDLGVRDMELVNKFDNALAGVAGDGGAAGPIVNNGNKYETNKYWDMRTCQTTEGDKEQPGVPRDLVLVKGFEAFLPPGEAPVYGAQPHCNVRGLTDLGEYLVRRMMDRKMIVDPDHLSQAARDELFAVTESRDYSGLISSHSWSNDRDYPRIYRNGGVVTPSDSRADGFVEDWQRLRKERARKYFYGIGFGSDLNGFSTAAGPPEKEEHKISYPFKSFDGGVTLDKQQSGDYTFDYNEEGVSHYGLYPDWVEGLRQIGGEQIVDDMANGAEAYLQMWERAEGVPGPRCRSRSSQLRRKGVRRVELGLPANEFLLRAGQPQVRDGRVWRWCLNKRRLRNVNITAVLTPRGRSALIATRARGHRDGKVAVGDKRRRVARYAEAVGNGLWTRDAGDGVQFVYGVRSGRVKFTGVANRAAAATPQRLLRYVRLGDLL